MNHPKFIIILSAILLAYLLAFCTSQVQAEDPLSKGQIKKLINRVIDARLPSMQGPKGDPGPQGPAGPPGLIGGGLTYARVLESGEVDAQRSNGITSSDVLRIPQYDPFALDNRVGDLPRANVLPVSLENAYCFNVPANGAQVTVDSSTTRYFLYTQLNFYGGRYDHWDCTFLVTFTDQDQALQPAAFFITVY